MAGLYCDITLLASVGNETATKTISRQAILYSSSGLMFSADKHRDGHTDELRGSWMVFVCDRVFATHRSFERTEPPPEPGRSHRVNLLLRTARKRSWPPGNGQNIHVNAKSGTSGSVSTSTSPSVCFTFMSVSRGMWSLKSSTELTRKGMWQDKTWKKQNRHRLCL